MQVFVSWDELLKWARMTAYGFGFVIVILRSDTVNGQRGRKTYVFLGCKRGDKYRRYKKDLDVSESGNRKCDCPFRLRGRPMNDGERWILKLACGSHNHDLAETLVGHPYAGRLTNEEKSTLVEMTKTSAKPRNILITLKKHNEKNVTTIKQVYNAINTYRRTRIGHRTEMQHLMMLLE